MPAKDLVFTVLGIDQASRTFDKVGDSIDRMGNRATTALGGIATGSGAAAAAVAASVGGLPLMFAAFGAVALRENEAVRQSFSALSQQVESGLMQDAEPLEQAFVGAAEQISGAYTELRPQMAQAFAASAPHVETLTTGVLDFAENAMPGMVTSVERAGPVMIGLASLMSDTGTGVSEFFTIVSTGSEEAGLGLQHFGLLAQEALPEVGSILVTLTGLWAEHGDEVVSVVTSMIGVFGQLSGSALPVVSAAMGVTLDVLQGALNVIEPLSGAIGPLIGMWLSLATAMRGMRAVRGAVAGATASVISFQESLDRAAGARGAGRLSVAARGVMGLLGGPWGLALAGATAALAIFGASSQSSAQDQRDLASALRDSGGAFDANAQRVLFNSDQYQSIADNVTTAGISHRDYITALIEGGPALDQLRARLKAQVAAGRETTQGQYAMQTSYNASATASMALLEQTGSLRGMVKGAAADFRAEASAVTTASGAMIGAVPGATALDEAIKTLGNSTASTTDRVDALNTAWRQLFGIEISLREATAQWEAGLDSLRESLTGARNGTGQWTGALFTASGAINLTTQEGRQLHDGLVQQGEQYRRLAQTAYDTALRQGASQRQATAAAVAATNTRRAQFIREAQTMGFTAGQAQRLANEYFGIPEDVATLITTPGARDAIRAALGVRDAVNSIDTYRQVTVEWVVTGDRARAGYGGYMPKRAHGGPVTSGRPVLVGEHGPELIVPSGPAQVLPTRETARVMQGGGHTTVNHFHLAVYNAANNKVDLETQFGRLALQAGI